MATEEDGGKKWPQMNTDKEMEELSVPCLAVVSDFVCGFLTAPSHELLEHIGHLCPGSGDTLFLFLDPSWARNSATRPAQVSGRRGWTRWA